MMTMMMLMMPLQLLQLRMQWRFQPGIFWGHGSMASAVREPITGVWGLRPQRGPGAEPLVRVSGRRSPLKLKHF